MDKLSEMSVSALLRLEAAIGEELRARQVLRGSNKPAGDYAEWLFARAFGWRLEASSAKHHDAVCSAGYRYQIKCRQWLLPTSALQLGAIRNLSDEPFDYLAVLLLNGRYEVDRAALLPFSVVATQARYQSHVNAWRLVVRETTWALPGVEDVTDRLRRVEPV